MTGRPTIYSEELVNEICERIEDGEPLRQICLLDHMPSYPTLKRWIRSNEAFRTQYARAKELQADAFAEELIEIADNSLNDWVEREAARSGEAHVVLNEEAIARSKVRIETRKWLMGKMKPKKYGDSTQIKHADADGDKLDFNKILSEISGTTAGLPRDKE